MKVVITGAAGFVGSHLTKECVRQGYDVIGIDNLATGRLENIKKERFFRLPGKFEFKHLDINHIDMYRYLDGADTVFHLAALPRVQFSIDYPLEANKANITGTLSVLEAARIAKVKRVIFSSSSSVYGGAKIFPTAENAEMPMPRSPYALAKLAGEHYCRIYSELHGVDTVSLRYFNLFGENQIPGGPYSTVICAFMDRKFNGGECQINGDGSVSRDFCYVGNVVDANLLAAKSKKIFNGDVFNIACGETYTINNIYEKICDLSGTFLPKRHGPPRKGDPKKSHADITKAQKILGYNPNVKFAEGLEKTYKWWKNGCKN